MKRVMSWVLVIGIVFVATAASARPAKIWDGNISGWTTNFANGTPIDNGSIHNATQPAIATDSQGNVYSTFTQLDTNADTHIYLSRYDGVDVRIWDANLPGWTNVFVNGTPIESGNESDNSHSQIAIDSQDNVYVTYISSNTPNDSVYLSRYNGVDVRIWDAGTASWTTNFMAGTPLDAETGYQANNPRIAIDSQDRVYITFAQKDAGNVFSEIYLSRYDGVDARIWDEDTNSWTTTFTDGDPIDLGTDIGNSVLSATFPQLAIDSQDNVYVTFLQLTEFPVISHVYLSRYDGVDINVWDNDTTSFSTILAVGDPIDAATGFGANIPELTIDSQNRVYVAYSQSTGVGESHIFLNRYDGATVNIWDQTILGWTTTFVDADPIDIGTIFTAAVPQLAVGPQDNVYITYEKNDVNNQSHIYLNRFRPATPQGPGRLGIWDNGFSRWTSTFADGDPIDQGGTPASSPQLAIDSRERVFITYVQYVNGAKHVFLSAYNRRDVKIWDINAPMWTDNFAIGDPIDAAGGVQSLAPQIDIYTNPNNRNLIYINYEQLDMPFGEIHIFLDRKVQ